MSSGDGFLLFVGVAVFMSGVRALLLEYSGEAAWAECGEPDIPLVSGEELILTFSAGEGVVLGSAEYVIRISGEGQAGLNIAGVDLKADSGDTAIILGSGD